MSKLYFRTFGTSKMVATTTPQPDEADARAVDAAQATERLKSAPDGLKLRTFTEVLANQAKRFHARVEERERIEGAARTSGYHCSAEYIGEDLPRRRWRVVVLHNGETLAVGHVGLPHLVREFAQATVDRDLA